MGKKNCIWTVLNAKKKLAGGQQRKGKREKNMLYIDARNLTVTAAEHHLLTWADDSHESILIHYKGDEILPAGRYPEDLDTVVKSVQKSPRIQDTLISKLSRLGVTVEWMDLSGLKQKVVKAATTDGTAALSL